MANDFGTFLFGGGGAPTNAPLSTSHAWLAAPAGFQLQYEPPCEACNLWQDHALPYRSCIKGGTIPATQRPPGHEFMQKLVDLLEVLWWIGAGSGDVGFNDVGNFNQFNAQIPLTSAGTEEPLVVGASGQVLTLESDFDPTHLAISERLENPLWIGPGGDVARILWRPYWTAIQALDSVGFGGSPLQGRAACRVITPPTGTTSGSERAYRWTMTVDQTITSADQPIEHPDDPGVLLVPKVNIGRYFWRPPNWFEAHRPGPRFATRRVQAQLSASDVAGLPSGELRLTNSGGGNTTIPFPVADDLDNRQLGTVRVTRYRESTPDVREDITAQTISQGRWRNAHDGTGDAAYFSAGTTVNGIGGQPTLVPEADHVLLLQYEAKARAHDPAEFQRTTGSGTCKHSRVLPDGSNYCGLASEGVTDFAAETTTGTPPSGLDEFRADAAGGCRQWQTGVIAGPGSCDRYQDRNAYSPAEHYANLMAALWWGVPQYVERALSVLQRDITFRPASPSGVPGLVQMLGLPMNTPNVAGFQDHAFSESAWGQFDSDDEGRPRFWNGAHYRLVEDVPAPTVEFDNANTWQSAGVLSAVITNDGLGRPLTDDTDYGRGMREARPIHFPAAVDCYTGAIVTPPLSGPFRQHVDSDRRFAAPRVSLDLLLDEEGAPTVQRPDSLLAVTVIESEDTPGEPGQVSLRIQTFGGWHGSHVAPKATAIVESAVMDGDLVKLELARELRTVTFVLPAEPNVGVTGQYLMGGNVVKRAARFQPRDKSDQQLRLIGANPILGAWPGDVARLYGVNTGDPTTDAAFATLGFFVDKGKSHSGLTRDQDWPETWQTPALEVPFEQGDNVWLHDEHGLLAANLGSLMDATFNVATSGFISPLRDPSVVVEYSVYDPETRTSVVDWAAIDAAELFVARAEGVVVVSAEFADSLRASYPGHEFCFQVTCDFLNRERKVDARALVEVEDALNTGFQKLRVFAGSAAAPGIITVTQELDGRTGEYGLQQNEIAKWAGPNAHPAFANSWTVGQPDFIPDLDTMPTGEPFFDQCTANNWVHDVGAGNFAYPDTQFENRGSYLYDTFLTLPASPIIDPASAKPFARIQWGTGIGLALGPLARLPKGATITGARIAARWAGIATSKQVRRVYSSEEGSGDPDFLRETISEVTTEGTGSLRLALMTNVFNEERGVRFPQVLAVSGSVSATDDDWVSVEAGGLFNTYINEARSGNYQDLYIVGLGDGPDPDENADTALLGIIQATRANVNVNPYLSACTGEPPFSYPVDNPAYRTGIDFEYESYSASWDGMEIWPEVELSVSLPSDPTAGGSRPLNVDFRHSVARPFPAP